ncbi:group II intron reverse transcriptase/maturase [Pedobacter jamesrossensis]
MGGKKQKISIDNYRQKDRAEPEDYVGVQTSMWITENNLTSLVHTGDGSLEQIFSLPNLNRAYKRVIGNRGSGGIDGMQVGSLKDYLIKEGESLQSSILSGQYRPNPVRRVEIPKEGGKRLLGIPTVVDRVIQQCVTQTLGPIYESQFSSYSYGFRPGRSAHQALKECVSFLNDGFSHTVDIDLEKFFDTVNQSKLIEVLSRTIKDGRMISLIHKYLRSGVIVAGKFEQTNLGVPQGGPLSPLLSNIMLNELDKELTKRGHRFVRYADDLVVFCRSKRGAQRTMASTVRFIRDKLFLGVNLEKSKVEYAGNAKFLGYSFYKTKGLWRLRTHPKSASRMKAKLRMLTSRSNGWSNDQRKDKLKQFVTGWVGYFKLADMKSLLSRTDEWLRRRLRMIFWKQWKLVRTRIANLVKLGIERAKAFQFANTRKSLWRTSNSPILSSSVTTKRLEAAGYPSLAKSYSDVRN